MYSIIPTRGFPTQTGHVLDKKALAYFASSGFFFENDSYWQEMKWKGLRFDDSPWHYQPRDISLTQAVDEFKELFEDIVKEQINNRKPLLALSGGLDSRTLAAALHNLKVEPHTYSYRFAGSFEETKYGKAIARCCGWSFDDITIPEGYLWQRLEEAGQINRCYAEFTHARQWAVVEELSQKGDIWLLGHWGDVLFDDMGISSDLNPEAQQAALHQKILKKGGQELASDLWDAWDLPGQFTEALDARLHRMLARIEIKDANARVRAFKSMYWATRWTTTNLAYFENFRPMSLPYYDDRMCRFIMSVPEKHLAGRQIQIEYIKRYAPQLAAIPWQSKAPYNLYSYHRHFTPAHLPYRIANKIKHTVKAKWSGKPLVQRNWEIQFLGTKNDQQLRNWLFENQAFSRLVPPEITEKYYNLFLNEDKVYWSHPLSILLTLSVFAKSHLTEV